MSRLIVKNLPTYATPERLKAHFLQAGCPLGTVTDVKVAMRPDGTSRRFGFVGYKTEQEALIAKEWFDKTFIDSTRITVLISEGAKDAPAPRPNKRPRLGPSPTDLPDDNSPSTSTLPSLKKSKKDVQLDEYMEVMKPRKGPAWANDAEAMMSVDAKVEGHVNEAGNANEDSTNQEGLSDLDWLRKHTSKNVEAESKDFVQSEDEDNATDSPNKPVPRTEEVKDPVKETILQTARLFVRNLSFSVTESDLLGFFSPSGEISQVHIPLDSLTGQSKGLAYVTFKQSANALSAYETLDKKSFQGRLIHILAAVDRKGKSEVEDSGKKHSLKDDLNTKRKGNAGKEFNWSMLFMNSDAVASSIADRMSISKTDILNPDNSDNPAVKLALAETHIINETKAYLESQGILISSFGTRKRSDTTILVKNIPYGTTEDQIREMFEAHGSLSRVIVPPSGTIAVVEFERGDEASKAFRAIAYRRLGNSIIYLEKGPIGMFTDTPPEASNLTFNGSVVRIPEQDTENADEELPISAGTTLFVKNLAFATTEERLTQIFGKLPSFSFARVQTKPDPKKPEGRLSMGYGFVGFKDAEGAHKAIKSMQGFVLDGHALHIKFAGRGTEEVENKTSSSGGVGSQGRTAKMIVKNIPFEATKKDIRDLFGAHGHLKSVRLPKKFDSRTRGFAFLEYVSRREAENAYETLRHTHLLGRHLVLEWAEEAEQDLDVLRKKAGTGYGAGKDIPGRKRKVEMDVAEED